MRYPTCDPMTIYIDVCFFLNEILLIKKDSLKYVIFDFIKTEEEEKTIAEIITHNINRNFNLNVERDTQLENIQFWIENCFEGILKDLHFYFTKGLAKKKADDLTWLMYQQLVKKQKLLENFLCERVDEKCAMTWMFYNDRLHQYNIFNTVKDWNLL